MTAVKIPTTQELVDTAITIFQNKLNQTVPSVDQSFIRVDAAVLALSHTTLYRFAVERVLQNLAITATGSDLEVIGRTYGVIRKPAVSAVHDIEATGTNGVSVPVNRVWVHDASTLRHRTNASVVVTGGLAEMEATSQSPGSEANMSVGETLTIDQQIAGLSNTATVTAVVALGVDQEDQEAYRRRVLNEIRTVGGGGNGVDYRTWGELPEGVLRVFPYAGSPLVLAIPSYPGDRSVFVEATSDVDPDGLAPQWLLDEVRNSINIDPDTGFTRPPLGDFDATLWVESIARTTIYNQVTNLDVDPAIEVATKADIQTALTLYYLLVVPYLSGIDPVVTKNNVITTASISGVVQAVVRSVGGDVDAVNFGLSPGVFTESKYTLGQGELVKSGGVVYV